MPGVVLEVKIATVPDSAGGNKAEVVPEVLTQGRDVIFE